MKAQGLLLLSIVVTIVNLVNLVILEVNSMHISTKTSKPGPADSRKKNELEAFLESLRPPLSIAWYTQAMANL